MKISVLFLNSIIKHLSWLWANYVIYQSNHNYKLGKDINRDRLYIAFFVIDMLFIEMLDHSII